MGKVSTLVYNLMRPVVKHLRRELGYRVLLWIDDFLCAPTDGRPPATVRDCRQAGKQLDLLFRELGITRHSDNGCWEGAKVLEHWESCWARDTCGVFVTDRKIHRGGRWLEIFCCALNATDGRCRSEDCDISEGWRCR
jgi:hypothetical protein